MKIPLAMVLVLLSLTAGRSGLQQRTALQSQAPVDLAPSGPLLLLQAKDLTSLVSSWNKSEEKSKWLGSANFEVFSRSRLLLRLGDALTEFTGAAGFTLDSASIGNLAGREAALAIYDIGKLEFLFVSRMPSAKLLQTAIWRSRAKYQTRSAAGRTYYLRTDPVSHRSLAFAGTDGCFILATREDLIAGALKLAAGHETAGLRTEAWFKESIGASGPAGELRLLLNLERLVRSPHFRSYWIQGNLPELRGYRAGVIDLHPSTKEVREERVFLRSESNASPRPPSSALAETLEWLPADFGLCRAWTPAAIDEILPRLERGLLALRPVGSSPASGGAQLGFSGGMTETPQDLEIRIDEPTPAHSAETFESQPMRRLLEAGSVDAVLQVQSSGRQPGNSFVTHRTLFVIHAERDWDGEASRQALLEAVGGLWTVSGIGAKWMEAGSGTTSYHVLDGLAPMAIATRGRVLIIGNSPEQLTSLLNRRSTPPAKWLGPDVTYAAMLHHARERPAYTHLMRMIDHIWVQQEAGGEAPDQDRPEPQFFSENLGSLSDTLSRVESASIVVRDLGARVQQTVVYSLSP